eukprot:9706048-Prorocentrum_lima.AAC.1
MADPSQDMDPSCPCAVSFATGMLPSSADRAGSFLLPGVWQGLSFHGGPRGSPPLEALGRRTPTVHTSCSF